MPTWSFILVRALGVSTTRIILSIYVIVLVVCSGRLSLGQNGFTFTNAPRDYPAGLWPGAVAIGDFNGDGRPDVATANYYSNDISILLQNPDGTFTAAVSYPTPAAPFNLQVGDVNNDGKLDLILITASGSTVTILFGNGDGTFQAPTNMILPNYPGGLAVGDFNHDGKLDLAVGIPLPQVGARAVAVFLGNGDGTFQAPVNYPVVGAASSMAVGDFNNDGKLDILADDSVLLGNGDGTFQAPRVTPSLAGTLLGDFNNDGKLDVVGGSAPSGSSIALGNGDGTFTISPVLINGTSSNAGPVAVGDVNGDGNLDLVMDSGIVALGDGHGGFSAGAQLILPPTHLGAATLTDLNRDGKLDLVVTSENTHGNVSPPFQDIVSVALGNGDGTFGLPNHAVSSQGSRVDSMVAADWNNDGKTDLAVYIGNGPSAITTLVNTAAGFVITPVIQAGDVFGTQWLAAGDFNGDGQTDMAFTSPIGGIQIALSTGGDTFQSPVGYGLGISGPLVLADLNNDGKLDIVGTNSSEVGTLLGNGDGTFGYVVTSLGGVTVESFAAADFNQDGIPDLAITGRLQNGPRSMFVALGNGDGTFTLAGTYNASLAPPLAASVVAVGDVNGDHIPDIIVANSDGFDSQTGQYTPSNVAVLLGIGNGQFSPPITTVAGNGPRSIVIADLNGDGKADVAISNVGWNDISLLLGNGDGSFQQPVNFGMDGAGPLAVADFNGDGSPDLAVGFGNTVSILYSSSSGPAASLSSTSVGFGNEGIGYISSASTLTLSNTGSTTLNISAMSLFGPQSSEFQQVSNCGPTLASGAHCTFQVSFNPQASGLRTATIRITDNAFNSPQNIFLSGTGVTPLSAVSISPGSLTFGNQYVGSSSAPRTVTLSSTGNIPLTFSGIALSGANASDFSSTNNCPTSLSNGTSCTISVVFSPGAARSSTASLAITDGAANSPQTVSITGTAVAPSLGLGLAPGGVSTATVSAGSRATYSLAIGGMGMSGAASLTCSGTPTGAVCSVPPTETLSAGTPLTFSVSVTTTAPTIGLSHPWRLTPPRLFFAMGLLMVFVLPGSFGKRRQSSCLLVLMLVALLCCCGGGSVPQANLNRTPSGTYPLVVSASMGGQTENVTLKLIVQ